MLLLLALWTPTIAPASPAARHALVISANRGSKQDPPLRYAARDAARVAELLKRLGGFLPENVIELTQRPAPEVRATLTRLNARLRREGGESMLLVYYSGHADAKALHLGDSRLPWDELRLLTEGSPATTRLLVVDACRSGEVTLVKGTERIEAFALPSEDTLPEGFAILSSAAAGESAHESDRIQGSFFTHHLLSGLQGLADRNGDGQVTLTEAFDHARDRTIAASARTLAGVQHPTYRYDLRGRIDLVLARADATDSAVSRLVLSAPGHYLIRQNGKDGPLTVEAALSKEDRVAWIPAGRYFVQRRLSGHMLEGDVTLAPQSSVEADQLDWREVRYAQYARKGGAAPAAWALSFWGGRSSAPLAGYPGSWSGRLQASWDGPAVSLDVVAGYGQSTLLGSALNARLFAYEFLGGFRKVIDLGPLSLSAGLRAGIVGLQQRFSGRHRLAPPRHRWAPRLDSVFRAEALVTGAWFAAAEATVMLSALRADGGVDAPTRSFPVQAGAFLGVGRYW